MKEEIQNAVYWMLENMTEPVCPQDALCYFCITFFGTEPRKTKETNQRMIRDSIHSFYKHCKTKQKIAQLTRQSEDMEQRTEKWYYFRYNMITASSVWKIFRSDAQRNSLIYEKCHPYRPVPEFRASASSLQWGQKYEALSAMIYEADKGIKPLGQFGCIRHPTYSFLGASPDGIVIDEESPWYGTMVEIKNIVNRAIMDKPKDEYWVQMQIQMEVCDLNQCHFVETRFQEPPFSTWTQFSGKKGVFQQNTFYIYSENEGDLLTWVNRFQEPKIYWVLDEYSCMTIPRDREWFQRSISAISETWETILHERSHGYEHRRPKTRIPKPHSSLCPPPTHVKSQMHEKLNITVIKCE
jgi:putative phage-type endonuclease